MRADQLRTALWDDRQRQQPHTGTLAPCPRTCRHAHEDRHPSFNVSEQGGRTLVRCHAACSQDEAIEALRALGLWDTPEATVYIPPPEPEPEALPFAPTNGTTTEYVYATADGAAVAIHGRWDHPDQSKTVRWRLPDGDYANGLQGLALDALPLYGAELLATNEGDVYICEGEKACDAARDAGLLAVSLPGGAAQRKFGGLDALTDRVVRLWPDNDEAGRGLMSALDAALSGIATETTYVQAPVPHKGDAWDYFSDGGTLDDLIALAEPVTERISDDTIRVTLPSALGPIEALFRSLMASRRSLDADISIRPPGAAYALRRRCNLLSSSGVAALSRELKSAWPEATEWQTTLPRLVAMCVDAWSTEDTTIDLALAPEAQPARWMLEGVIGEGHAILFGDGSSLKTVTALSMAISVAYGIDWLGQSVERVGPVLFLDWENDQASWSRYATRLLDGLDLPREPHRLLYRNARGAPLSDMTETVRRTIEEHGVQLVVVDSGGLACGGEPENSLSALSYFNAIASLGVPALTICHVNKGVISKATRAAAIARPHGSTFWFNSARVLTYCAREALTSERYLVTLENRKSNISGAVGNLAVRCDFDDPSGAITFSRTDFASTQAATEVPLKRRVLNLLSLPMTVTELLPMLGEDIDPDDERAQSRVRTTLNRLLKDQLVTKTQEGGRTLWASI